MAQSARRREMVCGSAPESFANHHQSLAPLPVTKAVFFCLSHKVQACQVSSPNVSLRRGFFSLSLFCGMCVWRFSHPYQKPHHISSGRTVRLANHDTGRRVRRAVAGARQSLCDHEVGDEELHFCLGITNHRAQTATSQK